VPPPPRETIEPRNRGGLVTKQIKVTIRTYFEVAEVGAGFGKRLIGKPLTGAAFIGTIGLDWQFAGIAPIHAAGASDLVLRNVNTGTFEVYDIANNQLMGAGSLGQVGPDWQVGGFAADPPTGATGSSGSSCRQWPDSAAAVVRPMD
jgi:hypothetical protein